MSSDSQFSNSHSHISKTKSSQYFFQPPLERVRGFVQDKLVFGGCPYYYDRAKYSEFLFQKVHFCHCEGVNDLVKENTVDDQITILVDCVVLDGAAIANYDQAK